MGNEIQKVDIKKTLELIAAESAKVEKAGKGDVQKLAVCVNLLAAIVSGQEDRLLKIEKNAEQPYTEAPPRASR